MSAEERSRKWIEELDEIERMTPVQLRNGLRKLSREDSFAGLVARVALAVWRCEGCRKLWDQDENAARNLLAAIDSSGLAAGLVEVAAPKRARITRRGDRSKNGRQDVAPPPQIS